MREAESRLSTGKVSRAFSARRLYLLASYLAGMTGAVLAVRRLSFLSDDLEGRFHILGFKKGLVLAGPVGGDGSDFISGRYVPTGQENPAEADVCLPDGTAAQLAAAGFVTNLVPSLGIMVLLGIAIGAVLPPINRVITGCAPHQRAGPSYQPLRHCQVFWGRLGSTHLPDWW